MLKTDIVTLALIEKEVYLEARERFKEHTKKVTSKEISNLLDNYIIRCTLHGFKTPTREIPNSIVKTITNRINTYYNLN